MMSMHTRNEYLKTLIEERGYLLQSKQEKSRLLDEYCANTGQNRKYVIRKIRLGKYLKAQKRKRSVRYDGEVTAVLAQCWKIFDRPCGQRLAPLLKTETERLRTLGELTCADGVLAKLQRISARTIDSALQHQKEVERWKRPRRDAAHPLLYQKIPVKLSDEQDRTVLGNEQVDLVEHCGASTKGEYAHTVSVTDIASGWWEGEAIPNRGQRVTEAAIDQARIRCPFPWREIHSDNDTAFINGHLFRYAERTGLSFSRSRPYRKNDNCFVEQKNWTHVKRCVGYLRYDTPEELAILQDLYRHELRLYKNFFQPVIKLVSKERVGGKVHRRYDTPKTPYHRILESVEVPEKTKAELQRLYQSLNPAELKRQIDRTLARLWAVHQQKQGTATEAQPARLIRPRLVTFSVAQPARVRLPG